MQISEIKSIRYFFISIVCVLCIHSFSIANDEPDPEKVKYYTDLMAGNTSLELGMYDDGASSPEPAENPMGDEGAVALAEPLKTNNTVTYLDISDNKIGNKGAQALANALKINDTLETLILSYNLRITAEGWQAIADALKVNKTLKRLEWMHAEEWDPEEAEKEPTEEENLKSAAIREINRQTYINKHLPKLLRDNWPKVKQLFLGYTDAESVLSKMPKELILKIIQNVLDLEKK